MVSSRSQKTFSNYDSSEADSAGLAPAGVSWTRPEGGLFLFLTLPEGFDTVALYDRALAAGVAYVAGSFFFVDGSHRNTMRLNFSFLDASRMEAGIKLLAEVIQ